MDVNSITECRITKKVFREHQYFSLQLVYFFTLSGLSYSIEQQMTEISFRVLVIVTDISFKL